MSSSNSNVGDLRHALVPFQRLTDQQKIAVSLGDCRMVEAVQALKRGTSFVNKRVSGCLMVR
jgi:hypothetical protein